MICTACYVMCDICRNTIADITTDGSADARAIAKRDGFVRIRIDGKLRDVCFECKRAYMARTA